MSAFELGDPAAVRRGRDVFRVRPATMMNSPASARRGNQGLHRGAWRSPWPRRWPWSPTRARSTTTGWIVMIAGALLRRRGWPVRGADGRDDRHAPAGQHLQRGGRRRSRLSSGSTTTSGSPRGGSESVDHSRSSTILDVLIGAVTFSGSIIAAGKLQGLIDGGGRSLSPARGPSTSRAARPSRPAARST